MTKKRLLGALLIPALALSAASLAAPPAKKGAAKGPAKSGAKDSAKPEPAAPATPAKLELVQVNDRRSSGHFAGLNLHVVLPDVPEKDVAAERITATKATDDTGASLLEESRQGGDLQPTASGMGYGKEKPGEKPSPTRLTISLTSPARGATKVVEVAGEIELYVPSRDPNAVVEVKKVLTQLGKPLAAPGFQKNGVEISLLTKAQVEAEKKKAAEKKRAEMKKDGFGAEMIEEMVKSFLESFLPPSENEIVARVKDPGNRIQSWAYVTPSGERKNVAAMDRDGFHVLTTWGEKPESDWTLRVELKTPKTMVRHTFQLANIELP